MSILKMSILQINVEDQFVTNIVNPDNAMSTIGTLNVFKTFRCLSDIFRKYVFKIYVPVLDFVLSGNNLYYSGHQLQIFRPYLQYLY